MRLLNADFAMAQDLRYTDTRRRIAGWMAAPRQLIG